MKPRIALIGTGHVAHQLAPTLARNSVLTVYGTSLEKAVQLIGSSQIDAKPRLSSEPLSEDFELIILAVPDRAIVVAGNQMKLSSSSGLVVHTSGAIAQAILNDFGNAQGVFYPLQTFSKNKPVDFSNVPWLLEASQPDSLSFLKSVARWFQGPLIEMNSEKRLKTHLAAVFACNFTNHLFRVSRHILKDTGADFSHLKHLIHETVDKAFVLSPENAQTGPASRGDEVTLKKHLDVLGEEPELKALYQLMSDQIQKASSS